MDAKTSEKLKVDLETSTDVFYNIFQHIWPWKYDTIPNDCAKMLTIKLPKSGDLICGVYNLIFSTQQSAVKSPIK